MLRSPSQWWVMEFKAMVKLSHKSMKREDFLCRNVLSWFFCASAGRCDTGHKQRMKGLAKEQQGHQLGHKEKNYFQAFLFIFKFNPPLCSSCFQETNTHVVTTFALYVVNTEIIRLGIHKTKSKRVSEKTRKTSRTRKLCRRLWP